MNWYYVLAFVSGIIFIFLLGFIGEFLSWLSIKLFHKEDHHVVFGFIRTRRENTEISGGLNGKKNTHKK